MRGIKQIIGQIVSKNTGKVYIVRWDPCELSVWLEISDANIMVYKNCLTTEDAIVSAQKFIDFQSKLY